MRYLHDIWTGNDVTVDQISIGCLVDLHTLGNKCSERTSFAQFNILLIHFIII